MPSIRRLSQSIVNKIAAGEVIERPASVVKELMENAVDAGATRIDVAIQSGGVELVRVCDNGCGIPAEELELAVSAHATSKIASADDLFAVGTLGFRGEALASIAEVSRLVLRSRVAEAPSGAEISVSGGQASAVAPCGCPIGTTVEVRDLFFNTPVRRKFLRSTQTELGHTSEAFVRVVLASPHLHATLQHNGRPVFELAGDQGWLERIERVFGRELAESLIWVESTDGPVRLSGYVAHPGQSRSNNRMQYLFLNGRCIRDRSLQHALAEAYRGLLLSGRYPIAILALQMPPEMVDVNVHPTKLEVRFQDSGRLYSQLLATLRTRFLATDLTTRVQTPAETDAGSPHDPAAAGLARQRLVDWAKGQVASWDARPAPAATGDRPFAAALENPAAAPSRPLELTPLSRPWEPTHQRPVEPTSIPQSAAAGLQSPTPDLQSPAPGLQPLAPSPQPLASSVKALQIHDRYLVAESDDGVMLIDQHALHERILYERLRARILSGAVETQSLLVPEPVDLGPAEAAAVLENRDLLAQLGLKIEPFGGNTVLVIGYPAMLANMGPAEVLRGLVDQLLSGGRLPDRRDLLDELLHTIACKAAIKAGDRLTPEEVDALVQQRHLIDDSHHCPHGRPTALVFSREELDKHFKRT
jgi:DNA mismatch repair protein MutL